MIWAYTLLSVLFVSLISFIGIFTISIKLEKLNKVLIYLVSFSAGALLGGAFLHLLPELIESGNFNLTSSYILLGGILLFFVLEKFVCWHHCHIPVTKEHHHIHPLAIMNLVGDGFHNFLDGLVIGASYLLSVPAGIATTLAVVVHEIPQEIGDFGVLIYGGFSRGKALFFNFASALVAFIGAIFALTISKSVENISFFIVPVAIGGFIYIAGSDLIPELHKNFTIKKSILQLIALIVGILVMAALLLLE